MEFQLLAVISIPVPASVVQKTEKKHQAWPALKPTDRTF
jgi:hypothetical protein